MKPNISNYAAIAALAGSVACGASTPEAASPETETASRKPSCDVNNPNNVQVISNEPDRIVLRVCETVVTAEKSRQVVRSTLSRPGVKTESSQEIPPRRRGIKTESSEEIPPRGRAIKTKPVIE